MDTTVLQHVARREEALGAVRQLLIERLGVRRPPHEIDPDAALFGSGLGLDSIDAVDLLVHLEARFQVRLPNDVAGRVRMRTVNSLVDLVLAGEDARAGA